MPESMKKTEAAQTLTADPSEFDKLLTRSLGAKTSTAQSAAQTAVRTLAERALAGVKLIPDNLVATIEGIIAKLDEEIAKQVNAILHHPDLTKLEGSWRGLHYLASHTETDEMLQIKVLNVSKDDLSRNFKKFKGAQFDRSPLFKKIYEDEFGTPGGQPYGMLMGDYAFGYTPPDVEILQGMAEIAAAAHAPFIAGTDPDVMGLDSWQDIGGVTNIAEKMSGPEYAAWNALRKTDNARYLSLTLPRTLARVPYGQKTSPVSEFAFEEDVTGRDHNKYVWSNAAYAMTRNVARAFKVHGWCAAIRGHDSGGMVEDLPLHAFSTGKGSTDMKCPTEVAIPDRREGELSKAGLMPLLHWKNTNYGVFISGQTLQKPTEYDDAEDTANAALSARLPYLFSTCRFAHYLKCMVRDKVGSFKSRADMESWLNEWITNFVTVDPEASEDTKAQKPLAEAHVEIEDVPGNPGYYSAKFFLKPHFQLEGLSVSLRLVSKLPAAGSN